MEDPLELLRAALAMLKKNKPDDRTDADRQYAIVIKDLEDMIAIFKERLGEAKF